MPFKEQKRAVGYVPVYKAGLLRTKLRDAGYKRHGGPAFKRVGEVATFRKAFTSEDGLRQNHVQIVIRGSTAAVYAHTEPHTDRLIAHGVSAMLSGASFSGGSRMLRSDLAAVGYDLSSFSQARNQAKRPRRA
jgi:hypothetical protein